MKKVPRPLYFYMLACAILLSAAVQGKTGLGNPASPADPVIPFGKTPFNDGWKLFVGEVNDASGADFDDSNWRPVVLPHDGSIEGGFNQRNPSGAQGGYLPTGAGYYRKTFTMPAENKDRLVFIDFDGIYRNSEVWINGYYLGKRPNGFISFRYELSGHLLYEGQKNIILVKVDNLAQPNSRWYTGSGIYRNVWLTIANKLHIDQWGVTITSPGIKAGRAILHIQTVVRNSTAARTITVKNTVFDGRDRPVAQKSSAISVVSSSRDLVQLDITKDIPQDILLTNPHLWSDTDPYLYKVITVLLENGKIIDQYETHYGIRSFVFTEKEGFILNGKKVKIRGVCNHQDLGCLGSAVNTSAIKRQLLILKEMGCNGIRTAHNPPAPELLDLCDQMGFIVMDEAFDVWTLAKTPFDYHWNWDQWHKRDLEDQVKRDRNHPSVFIWSIGNEIPEQTEGNTGTLIAKELRGIIETLDTTRPITAGNNHPVRENKIIQSGALDLIGYNYRHQDWALFPARFPGASFIATETVSALETRGEYSFPSDTIIRWGNPQHQVRKNPFDYTCSAYDQISTPWGSTHEETLALFNKYAFISGMFIWTGFDYLGEPTPYSWPARSSYFGIIDLAGFPKDVYYLYQSEWTTKPVLHLFPHWNWREGQLVDLCAYYNNADEVELFLNGSSMGVRKKMAEEFHVLWRIPFHPGVLKAVSRRSGKIVLVKEIRTAGKPERIVLEPDKNNIHRDQHELAFLTAKVVDANGTVVPDADNLISFAVTDNAFIAGADNGDPVSHESFKSHSRKAFKGLALAVVGAGKVGASGKVGVEGKEKGMIMVTARSNGLKTASVMLLSK